MPPYLTFNVRMAVILAQSALAAAFIALFLLFLNNEPVNHTETVRYATVLVEVTRVVIQTPTPSSIIIR